MVFLAAVIAFVGAMLIGILTIAKMGVAAHVVAGVSFFAWLCVASAIELRSQKQRLQRFGDRAHVPYTSTLDWVLKALPRWLLPGTIAATPPPKNRLFCEV